MNISKKTLYRTSVAKRKYSCRCKKMNSLSNHVLVTFCLMMDE